MVHSVTMVDVDFRNTCYAYIINRSFGIAFTTLKVTGVTISTDAATSGGVVHWKQFAQSELIVPLQISVTVSTQVSPLTLLAPHTVDNIVIDATVGSPVSVTLLGTVFSGAQRVKLYTGASAHAGALPDGLVLADESTGEIHGTPTRAGEFSVLVTATDVGGVAYVVMFFAFTIRSHSSVQCCG